MTFCNHEFTKLQSPPSNPVAIKRNRALITTTCKTRAVAQTRPRHMGLLAC